GIHRSALPLTPLLFASPRLLLLYLLHAFFFFHCSRDHRDLHSFPTRRSSDLTETHATPYRTWCPTGSHDGEHSKRAYAKSCYRRSEEHTSELQSRFDLVCRLLLEKKKK